MTSDVHTEVSVAPAADAPSVPRDVRVRLLDLMLLQRVAEDRIMALYRQGRIAGSAANSPSRPTGRRSAALGSSAPARTPRS